MFYLDVWLKSAKRNIMLFRLYNHSSTSYSSTRGTFWDGYVIYIQILMNDISIFFEIDNAFYYMFYLDVRLRLVAMRNIILFHFIIISYCHFSSTIIVRQPSLVSFLHVNMNWWIINTLLFILTYFVYLDICLRLMMRKIMLFRLYNHTSSLYSSMRGTFWDGYIIYLRIRMNDISILV